MIRAVVFDVGGVLVTNPLGEFARVESEYGLPEGTVMALFRGGSLFGQCEIGALPFADFCADAVAKIATDTGIAVPPARLAAMMAAIMGDTVNAAMLALVGEVKALGVTTAILTNNYAELHDWLVAAFPPELIDVYCESWALGVRKPDPAIYRRLLAMLGFAAEEVVFIDDFPENVEAAQAEGLHGVLFSGEPDLRRELRALRLLPPPLSPRRRVSDRRARSRHRGG